MVGVLNRNKLPNSLNLLIYTASETKQVPERLYIYRASESGYQLCREPAPWQVAQRRLAGFRQDCQRKEGKSILKAEDARCLTGDPMRPFTADDNHDHRRRRRCSCQHKPICDISLMWSPKSNKLLKYSPVVHGLYTKTTQDYCISKYWKEDRKKKDGESSQERN